MKKRIFASLTALLALLVVLPSCGGEEISFSYTTLSDIVEKAEQMSSCRLIGQTSADIFYQPTSLKKYDVHAEQNTDISYTRDEAGKLSTLQGSYNLKSGNEEEAYTVYYADGKAYFDEDGRKYTAPLSAESFAVQDMFRFFEEDEVQDIKAYREDGLVRVTFSVPWESASPKVNELYATLSAVLQSSGMTYSDVQYTDIQATFLVDENTNDLVSYTYDYAAKLKIDGVDVDVKGRSTCRIESRSVTLTPPDLTLWQ